MRDNNNLFYLSGAVKRTGPNGEVGGYLVRFSDATNPDLDGEFFTKDTYLGPRDGDESDCLFDHGIPIKHGLEALADEWFAPIKTRRDDIGIFASTILRESDAYQKQVLDLIDLGKIGWSSGSAPHLVKKKSNGEITRWPIIEGSLTHMPCEPRNMVAPMKSLREVIEDESTIKAVWTTAYQNSLPDSSFAYVEPGGEKDEEGKTKPRSLRHFPYKDKDGKPDAAHVRNALARIPQSNVSDDAKASALRKIKAAAKELGIDAADDSGKSITGKSVTGIYKEELQENINCYTIINAYERALCEIGCQQDAAGRIGATLDVTAMVDELLAAVMADLRVASLQRLDGSDDEMDMDMPMESTGYMMSIRHPLKTFLALNYNPVSRLPIETHSKMVVSAVEEIASYSDEIGEPLEAYAKHVTDKYEFRTKSGRTISAATREHLTATDEKMGTAIDHMTVAREKIKGLIDMTMPKPKVDPEKAKAVRMRLLSARLSA